MFLHKDYKSMFGILGRDKECATVKEKHAEFMQNKFAASLQEGRWICTSMEFFSHFVVHRAIMKLIG